MSRIKAIMRRKSTKRYSDTPVCAETLLFLQENLAQYNGESGLKMKMIVGDGEAFDGFLRSYGMFSGVENYILIVGDEADVNLDEKAGFFGEQFVLDATEKELGTSWVGATFSKKLCEEYLGEGEVIIGAIVFGHSADEATVLDKVDNVLYKLRHRKNLTAKDIYKAKGDVPEWFLNGIECAAVAPSALNSQPTRFRCNHGKVQAFVEIDTPYNIVNLGIAKLHFAVGAGKGKWKFGDWGYFDRNA